jgi:pimeloyl-ACP methyl ester carboxylesterase
MTPLRCVALVCTGFACCVYPVEAQEIPGQLHVVTVGEGPLTTVVLHGGPGMRHNYLRPEWDRLQAAGRLVYYDQRGCGRSPREGPYTWEQHVRDLDDLLNSLKPEGPVVLAGSSWGSFLALLYAYSHPGRVAGLILSGLPERVWDNSQERALREAEARLFSSRQRALAQPRTMRSPPPGLRDSATVAQSNSDPVYQRAGEMCIGARTVTLESFEKTAPLRESLRSVLAPTLLFRGLTANVRGDASEVFAGVLPNAKLISIAAGHDPWLEQPDLFFREAIRFIRSLGVAPPP